MHHFTTTIICATAVLAIASFAIDQGEALRIAALVENKCPSNCQGDFPMPSDRKYAEVSTVHRRS